MRDDIVIHHGDQFAVVCAVERGLPCSGNARCRLVNVLDSELVRLLGGGLFGVVVDKRDTYAGCQCPQVRSDGADQRSKEFGAAKGRDDDEDRRILIGL